VVVCGLGFVVGCWLSVVCCLSLVVCCMLAEREASLRALWALFAMLAHLKAMWA